MSRESLIDRELDEEFIKVIIIIQNGFDMMSKHDKVKTQSWIAKLAKITMNQEAKQSRNLYVGQLFECIMSKRLVAPFDKNPPSGNLPLLKPPNTGKSRSTGMGRMMKTEEIEKIIEANLMSLNNEEAMFELSPRDTFPNKTVKFDTSTIYEVTPSKSNRYRGKDSGQVSKRESRHTNNQTGGKLAGIEPLDEEEEGERYMRMVKIKQAFSNIGSLISSHVADMKPDENVERLKEVLNYVRLGDSLTSDDIKDMEKNNEKELMLFKSKYMNVMSRLESIESKNVSRVHLT